MKTIFLDIDGVLLHHHGIPNMQTKLPTIILPGVIDKLIEWQGKGYKIILTTGRRECERKMTINQLLDAGLTYDILIMGLNPGERIIINDFKPDSIIPTATSICLPRNKGLADTSI